MIRDLKEDSDRLLGKFLNRTLVLPGVCLFLHFAKLYPLTLLSPFLWGVMMMMEKEEMIDRIRGILNLGGCPIFNIFPTVRQFVPCF